MNFKQKQIRKLNSFILVVCILIKYLKIIKVETNYLLIKYMLDPKSDKNT